MRTPPLLPGQGDDGAAKADATLIASIPTNKAATVNNVKMRFFLRHLLYTEGETRQTRPQSADARKLARGDESLANFLERRLYELRRITLLHALR
jgi:hypothetical protein